MTDVLDLLSAHRSIRKFIDRPVDDGLMRDLIRAAQCAATSHHVQACTVIRVRDAGVRQTIADLAGPQPWVAAASVFLVFCADLTRLVHACDRHGIRPETGWAEQLLVAVADTALLAQNLMIAAESRGLGGVFIGGIRNDPETVSGLLKIPDQAFPVFGMCLGYPDEDPGVKPRLPVDVMFHDDRFPESADQDLVDAYDRTVRDYYAKRSPKLKDRTWTRGMADFTGRIIRPHMKSYLEKKGFFRK